MLIIEKGKVRESPIRLGKLEGKIRTQDLLNCKAGMLNFTS